VDVGIQKCIIYMKVGLGLDAQDYQVLLRYIIREVPGCVEKFQHIKKLYNKVGQPERDFIGE
jgi:hypothetical protein